MLDVPITVSELMSVVKELKQNKAPGNDKLLNEYFVSYIDILSFHLVDLFNNILNTGYFPASWTEGIIILLFKKDDPENVRNYRGITLLSCMSKLFTAILNKRINKVIEDNNVLSDAQFGFNNRRMV